MPVSRKGGGGGGGGVFWISFFIPSEWCPLGVYEGLI
jgi:hypothetical protein